MCSFDKMIQASLRSICRKTQLNNIETGREVGKRRSRRRQDHASAKMAVPMATAEHGPDLTSDAQLQNRNEELSQARDCTRGEKVVDLHKSKVKHQQSLSSTSPITLHGKVTENICIMS